jgi:hypothetical protein
MKGDLAASIQKKQKRIAALEQELLGLRQELNEAKAMLTGRLNGFKGASAAHQTRTRPIREGSAIGTALRVLREYGAEMHIDSLLAFMATKHGVQAKKTTLVSGLSRYVKAQDTFSRPRESVYGLLEFEREERAH